jgi:hypothetical protein
MNQDQRKFLIEQVNKSFQVQKNLLEEEEESIIEPSLNNYLVAAVFDGTFQLQDVEDLKRKIKERVLKFGKNDKLVSDPNDSYSRRGRDNKAEVTLDAADVFVLPEAYVVALEQYRKIKKGKSKELLALESQRDTIIMKIQIGSNALLDKLVMQIDNLGDLDLTNTQLALTAPSKQLTNE